MSSTPRRFHPVHAVLALLLGALTACSSSTGPSIEGIPPYPNATPGESMAFSSPGGFMGGKLAQLTTTDSYDEVIAFYQRALSTQRVQVQNYTTELGRQTAVTIPQEDGVITLAIQEFTDDGQVNITVMGMGS